MVAINPLNFLDGRFNIIAHEKRGDALYFFHIQIPPRRLENAGYDFIGEPLADFLGGISSNDGKRLNIFCDNGTRSYDGTMSDGHAGMDNGSVSDPNITPNNYIALGGKVVDVLHRLQPEVKGVSSNEIKPVSYAKEKNNIIGDGAIRPYFKGAWKPEILNLGIPVSSVSNLKLRVFVGKAALPVKRISEIKASGNAQNVHKFTSKGMIICSN